MMRFREQTFGYDVIANSRMRRINGNVRKSPDGTIILELENLEWSVREALAQTLGSMALTTAPRETKIISEFVGIYDDATRYTVTWEFASCYEMLLSNHIALGDLLRRVIQRNIKEHVEYATSA